MVRQEIRDRRVGILAAFGSFLVARSVTFAGIFDNPQEALGSFISDLFSSVGDAITSGLGNIVTATTGVFITWINGLSESVLNLVTSLVSPIADLFSDAISGVGDALTGAAVVPGVEFAAVQAPLGLPAITWGIVGIAAMGAGSSIVTGTDFPVVGAFGSGLGSILIVSGGMIGSWGFFPDLSKYVFMVVFLLVFASGAFVYINVASRLDQDAN